jgi:hypothetical protein
MSNAKDTKVESSKQKVAGMNKLPNQGFSKFGRGPGMGFGISKFSTPKAQFRPPPMRVTQNKGGGGK